MDEANRLLREILKDKPIVKRALGFVDINKPVERETMVSQIAIIAGVSRKARYETGIRGLVDMLVTSGLLEESPEGSLVSGKPPKELTTEEKRLREPYPEPIVAIETPKRITFPISLNFNIDTETDIENLKRILKAIKEVFSED